jgi:acyl-coenzyme A synthetase/AMP-(fatty) acid ligase
MTSEDIAEVAVVGIPDTLKGQVPLGLCVLKHGMYVRINFSLFLLLIVVTVVCVI